MVENLVNHLVVQVGDPQLLKEIMPQAIRNDGRIIQERGIAFAEVLAGFRYLERSQDAVTASRFLIDVRGPEIPQVGV